MTHIRYDLVPRSGGWSISMGDAVGPPYLDFADAVADTTAIARFLAQYGDSVEIVAWRGGKPRLIELVQPEPKPKPQRRTS
ncbi:MAG TPA: hypothetical protein VFE52_01970 [Devosia sp.]|nr:hypothetical protein [Devosia sp.]